MRQGVEKCLARSLCCDIALALLEATEYPCKKRGWCLSQGPRLRRCNTLLMLGLMVLHGFCSLLLEQITQEAYSARDRGFHGSHWLVQQFRDFLVVHALEIVAGKSNTIALWQTGYHDFKSDDTQRCQAILVEPNRRGLLKPSLREGGTVVPKVSPC